MKGGSVSYKKGNPRIELAADVEEKDLIKNLEADPVYGPICLDQEPKLAKSAIKKAINDKANPLTKDKAAEFGILVKQDETFSYRTAN